MNEPGPGSLGQSVPIVGCTRMFAHFVGHFSLSSGPNRQIGPFLFCCPSPQENDSAEHPSQSLLCPCRPSVLTPASQQMP